jgi:hypothetical protein
MESPKVKYLQLKILYILKFSNIEKIKNSETCGVHGYSLLIEVKKLEAVGYVIKASKKSVSSETYHVAKILP